MKNIKDRIEYLSSLKLLTSDPYGIWGIDIIGVIAGILFMLWGLGNPTLPGLWRLFFTILGAVLLIVCSMRIDRRYAAFKEKLLMDVESLQCSNFK